MIDLRTASPYDTMMYFVNSNKEWGSVIEDDKYFDNEELEDNFLVFYVYAFAHLGLPRGTRAQLEMAKFISDRTIPHKMVMAMRGLSKSLTSQIYVVWRLLNDPDEKILVMSAGSDRAKSYTQFVKKLIGTLPITRPMMPRHNIERTSTQMFDVAGSAASDSASIYAVGAGNQLAGFRATLVIYDDVETANSVESTTMMEKNDAGQRSHYITLEFSISDAPGPDEIIVALGASSGGRAHPRIGNRYQDLEDMDRMAAEAGGVVAGRPSDGKS